MYRSRKCRRSFSLSCSRWYVTNFKKGSLTGVYIWINEYTCIVMRCGSGSTIVVMLYTARPAERSAVTLFCWTTENKNNNKGFGTTRTNNKGFGTKLGAQGWTEQNRTLRAHSLRTPAAACGNCEKKIAKKCKNLQEFAELRKTCKEFVKFAKICKIVRNLRNFCQKVSKKLAKIAN